MRKHLVLIASIVLFSFLFIYGMISFFDTRQDINAIPDATLYSESLQINGIGPILAHRVVVYRNKYKPIRVVDLDAVKGIGKARLKLLREKFKD